MNRDARHARNAAECGTTHMEIRNTCRHTPAEPLNIAWPDIAAGLTRTLEAQHGLERLQHRPTERAAEVRRQLLREARVGGGPARGAQVEGGDLRLQAWGAGRP